MPDAPSPDAGSLSARAQEILRRADAQLAALKVPPPPSRPPEPEPESGEAPAEADLSRPPAVRDLGELLDTVEAGIGAARAHLITLSASLERIAQELDAAAEEHRRTLPPRLAEHARLPEEQALQRAHPAPEPEHTEPEPSEPEHPEPEPAEPAAPEARSTDAAYDAARLVAIEMAVAGDTREGVGRRLREEFGIRDPRPILDDAFGPDPGTPGRRYGA